MTRSTCDFDARVSIRDLLLNHVLVKLLYLNSVSLFSCHTIAVSYRITYSSVHKFSSRFSQINEDFQQNESFTVSRVIAINYKRCHLKLGRIL